MDITKFETRNGDRKCTLQPMNGFIAVDPQKTDNGLIRRPDGAMTGGEVKFLEGKDAGSKVTIESVWGRVVGLSKEAAEAGFGIGDIVSFVKHGYYAEYDEFNKDYLYCLVNHNSVIYKYGQV